MNTELPKRFYKTVTVEAHPEGFAIMLDGRSARTPGRKPLVVPTRALAEAVAGEWSAQEGAIDPARMPLTRLANTALDGVGEAVAAVSGEVAKYAASDLLCYRAGHPDKLVARQNTLWDPVLGWAQEALGARFILAEGVIFVEQPEPAVEAIRQRIAGYSSPFALAALHIMTTLTGSVLLALAVADGRLTPEDAWTAAHVDEDVQIEFWGEDAEATARRQARWRDFAAAATAIRLAQDAS
ncbi:ATP12 family chaperone protein [Chelatococcus sp. GCM10030263]|uniref:ATP12 family chaperone protein n=1 Tax=Chelatococcus sp. GCM10030263 TaxID=3273387 RepID=UPI00361CB85C